MAMINQTKNILENDSATRDHIMSLISQGFTSGEVHSCLDGSDEEEKGWWHLNDDGLTISIISE